VRRELWEETHQEVEWRVCGRPFVLQSTLTLQCRNSFDDRGIVQQSRLLTDPVAKEERGPFVSRRADGGHVGTAKLTAKGVGHSRVVLIDI